MILQKCHKKKKEGEGGAGWGGVGILKRSFSRKFHFTYFYYPQGRFYLFFSQFQHNIWGYRLNKNLYSICLQFH